MKSFLSAALASLLLVLGSADAFAQQKVSGTVKDAAGEPIIGASVILKGSNSTGTVTDVDGGYSLSVPAGSTIVASCIGYIEKEAVVSAGQSSISFVLEEDNTLLEETVVIGYQVVKRRDLTGSVASVTGKDLAQMPVADATQALQGKLPGVRITSSSGAPGATVSIRVRGGNSVTQSNEPLVLIDGVSGDLSNVPADQIESIDVLKDASSTAIYGARGANGVILVTTKGAKSGKVSVRYNMYYQYRDTPKMYPVMDAQDFILWQWSYATLYGDSYGDGVAAYYGLGSKYGNNYSAYANVKAHNHMYDVLKPSGTWNHDITLSGGTDETNYMITVGYLKDNGTRIKNSRDRYNVNVKLNQKISKSLSANFDLRYSEVHNYGKTDRTTNFAYRPIDNPLGDGLSYHLGQGDVNVETIYDPVLAIENTESFSKRYNLRGTAGLGWNPVRGLVGKSEVTLSRGATRSESWNGGGGIGGSSYKTAEISNGHSTNLRWTNTVSYDVQGLGKDHSLNFLLGHEMMTNTSVTSKMAGYGYSEDLTWEQTLAMFDVTDRSLGLDTYENEIKTPSRTLSFFGRANYSLKGRYLFTATFRADGSSKFAPKHRWGYFPAGAFAWRISDEPWMSDTKSWMDDLKFRLSYGTSGADGIDSSLWKETWVSGTTKVDGVDMPVYYPNSLLSNPDLKWETTISRNAGIDFSFLKSRIRGGLDFYWNTTKDLLMAMPVDETTGYSQQYQNVGQTSNKGIELSLNAAIVSTKDFHLSVNWTHSYNRNNLDWIDPSANANTHTGWGSSMQVPQYDYVIQVGRPVGLVSGFIADGCGFYTVDDFDYKDGKYYLKPGVHDTAAGIANYTNGGILSQIRPDGQNAFPGAAKFKDINGGDVADATDYDIIQEMAPHHTGGFGIQANWKNFDFSANFAYQLDGYIYNAAAMTSMMGNKDTSFGNNRLAYVSDCWKSFNVNSSGELYLVTDPAELKALNANAKYPVPYAEYGITTSQFIEPGGYLRLNNLTLGYTLPHSVLDKIKLSNLRVYVTGTNLFVLTKYSGLDPEVGDYKGTTTPAYDTGSYPRPITFTAGLSVTF